jgi:preprotein translocase SecE subunit
MEPHHGYAEAFPGPQSPEPRPGTEDAPPGRRPPTAVGYSGGSEPDRRHWFSARRPRHGVATHGVAVLSELQKVVWPTREEVIYLTTLVIVLTLLAGALLGATDLSFGWLIDRSLLR